MLVVGAPHSQQLFTFMSQFENLKALNCRLFQHLFWHYGTNSQTLTLASSWACFHSDCTLDKKSLSAFRCRLLRDQYLPFLEKVMYLHLYVLIGFQSFLEQLFWIFELEKLLRDIWKEFTELDRILELKMIFKRSSSNLLIFQALEPPIVATVEATARPMIYFQWLQIGHGVQASCTELMHELLKSTAIAETRGHCIMCEMYS